MLSVVGTGPDLAAARETAYRLIKSIKLPGSHFRGDIGLAGAEGRISVCSLRRQQRSDPPQFRGQL